MYNPGAVPLDPSQLSTYLGRELRALAGELNSYATKRILPVWTGATTNPVLGNGSLQMRYRLQRDVCELWLRLVVGSTTTFGTGAWQFEIPAPAKDFKQYGEAFLLDSGTNRFAGACEADTAATILRVYAHGFLNPVANTVPFTWAVGDELNAHIRYIC